MKKHNQEARVERCKNARMFEYIPVDPYDVFEIELWACYQIHRLNGTSGFRSFSIASPWSPWSWVCWRKIAFPWSSCSNALGKRRWREVSKTFFFSDQDGSGKVYPLTMFDPKKLIIPAPSKAIESRILRMIPYIGTPGIPRIDLGYEWQYDHAA